jgi:hypothetical protein
MGSFELVVQSNTVVVDGRGKAGSVDEVGEERQFVLQAEVGTTYEVAVTDFLVDFRQSAGAVSRRQLQLPSISIPSISTCDMERVASSCADLNALLVGDMCATDCAHAIADSFDGCHRDPAAYETVANIRDMVHICQRLVCSSEFNSCNNGECKENADTSGSEGDGCQCNPGWGGAECAETEGVTPRQGLWVLADGPSVRQYTSGSRTAVSWWGHTAAVWFRLAAEAGTTYEAAVVLGTLADSELSLVGMDGATELAASESGGAGVDVPCE